MDAIGINTVDSLMNKLHRNRSSTIKYISRLRKKGYVKTTQGSDKKRIYYIFPENKIQGKSYEEIINKYSPIKLQENNMHKIYGRDIPIEEVLVYAVKSNDIRTIIASLSLFRYVKDWLLLKKLAKDKKTTRMICALYDVARKTMKTKRMDKRFKRMKITGEKYEYFIFNFKSKDFSDIEKKWRIYLPLNAADLEDYK
ncbi:hypothetical protein JXB27_02330 [Candidatus Woesearchaeota archaeon]|nr:hypothetical protein [Candidatus Woesearchaeota archaeon]